MKRAGLPKEKLLDLYIVKRLSVAQISEILSCSQNKINYWLAKYDIEKRTISDAIYQLKNPSGDPFLLKQPKTMEESILFGLGLGLYWGEGSRRGTGGIRITNTDPMLLRKFIEFLERCCGVDKNKLKFSLQIFNDISQTEAIQYWTDTLEVTKDQFYKVVVSKVRGSGTYKFKSKNGVIIIYFNNIKLKRLICSLIENIR